MRITLGTSHTRLALTVALAASLVASCSIFEANDPFGPEYYSSNFIADIGFDDYEGAVNPAPAILPHGIWDAAYRHESGWDGYSYLTLEPVGTQAEDYTPVPEGLDPVAPVYRLTLVNLLRDGSFEADAGGTWSAPASRYTGEDVLTGVGSLRIPAGDEHITFNLDFRSGFSASTGLTYILRMRYPSSSFAADFAISETNGLSSFSPDSEAGRITINFGPSVAGSPLSGTIRPAGSQPYNPIILDDATLSMKNKAIIRLPLTRADTVPVLENGVYRFRVWVRPDPAANVVGYSAGAPAPYPLDTFFVSMRASEGVTLASDDETYTYSGESTWTAVSSSLSEAALQINNSLVTSEDVVITLEINLENASPGSILISAPELRFFSNL
jgi:hypothetical protein